MGIDDKVKNAAQEAKGKVEEGWGKLTGNEKLEAEGKLDQAGANVKEAGENVKDAFKK
ncbi:MAG: CsbD family protein [Propionicimonas sp.]|uniref:CsbD family protein n=1 Tax=Propionicimonas sp. TaxID=1955623 RepID=UPI003D12FA55